MNHEYFVMLLIILYMMWNGNDKKINFIRGKLIVIERDLNRIEKLLRDIKND